MIASAAIGTLSIASGDTATAIGILGTLATTNDNDLLSASGWSGIITGTVSAANDNDTVLASGSCENIVSSAPSGGYDGDFSDHPYLRPRPLSRAERKKLEREQARAIPVIEPIKQINAITNSNINSLTGDINKPSDDLIKQTFQDEQDRLKRYYQILARAALLT